MLLRDNLILASTSSRGVAIVVTIGVSIVVGVLATSIRVVGVVVVTFLVVVVEGVVLVREPIVARL
jgi:hypothetical protein